MINRYTSSLGHTNTFYTHKYKQICVWHSSNDARCMLAERNKNTVQRKGKENIMCLLCNKNNAMSKSTTRAELSFHENSCRFSEVKPSRSKPSHNARRMQLQILQWYESELVLRCCCFVAVVLRLVGWLSAATARGIQCDKYIPYAYKMFYCVCSCMTPSAVLQGRCIHALFCKRERNKIKSKQNKTKAHWHVTDCIRFQHIHTHTQCAVFDFTAFNLPLQLACCSLFH